VFGGIGSSLHRAAHCRNQVSAIEDLHLTAPPLDLPSSVISMGWHVRAERDPGHIWLRDSVARICAENAAAADPRSAPRISVPPTEEPSVAV
jgi:hypothetical protein